MTTSKQQAVAAAEARNAEEYNEFHQRVEDAIKSQMGERAGASVPTSGIRNHTIQRVIKTYEEAGWTCKLNSDQREGESLELS